MDEFEDLDFAVPDLGTFDLDVNLGDFSGVTEDADLEDSRYIVPKLRGVKIRHVIYEHASQLAAEVDFPLNARYDVVIGGNFVFGDFLCAFMLRNRCKARKMTINTLSLSDRNVDMLRDLMDKGYVDKLDLVVSDYFYSHELHGLVPYVRERLDIGGRFQMAVCSTHMKTVSILTAGGKKLVIHGSANLRSSGNIEQFTMEMAPELYDFYESITDKTTARYATINKSVRNKQLYNLLKD